MIVLGSNILSRIQRKTIEFAAAVKSASPGSFELIEIPLPA